MSILEKLFDNMDAPAIWWNTNDNNSGEIQELKRQNEMLREIIQKMRESKSRQLVVR